MASGTCQRQNTFAALLPPGSAILSNTGDNTIPGSVNAPPEGGTAVNLNLIPTLVVTISVTDFQAIQQRIADLEAAQHNTCCRCRSDSESDHKRATKRSNLKRKAPDKYWGETHQKLDAFIRQCKQNFRIDGCI